MAAAARIRGPAAAALLLLLLLDPCAAFYLPGVAPQDFNTGDELQVKVNTSVKTQLPYAKYETSHGAEEKNAWSKNNNSKRPLQILGSISTGCLVLRPLWIFHHQGLDALFDQLSMSEAIDGLVVSTIYLAKSEDEPSEKWLNVGVVLVWTAYTVLFFFAAPKHGAIFFSYDYKVHLYRALVRAVSGIVYCWPMVMSNQMKEKKKDMFSKRFGIVTAVGNTALSFGIASRLIKRESFLLSVIYLVDSIFWFVHGVIDDDFVDECVFGALIPLYSISAIVCMTSSIRGTIRDYLRSHQFHKLD